MLFNLSGHGHFDMSAYAAYFAGELEDLEMPEEKKRSPRRWSASPRRQRSLDLVRLRRTGESRADRAPDTMSTPGSSRTA